MGKEEQALVRLVLDTNVLVSALLFRSRTSVLLDAWLRGDFRLAVSEPILAEYSRVLVYPKFCLGEEEVASIVGELVLPYCDRFVPREEPLVCPDPDDDKFFHCAEVADAAALVSGDRAVLACRYRHVRVLTVGQALDRFCREP